MSDYFDATTGRIESGSLAKSTQVNTLIDAVGAGFDKMPTEANLTGGKVTYAADTGAANAYIVALPTTQTAYANGLTITFTPSADNTAASTIDVDGIGPITIKKMDGLDVAAGDIQAGIPLTITYYGGNFYFTGASPNSSNSLLLTGGTITANGADDALTITQLGAGNALVIGNFQVTAAGGLSIGGSDVVVDTDIGVTVQAYDADTAKYDDVTANFTGTLQNGGSNVVVDTDIGVTVQAYDANTAKYDDASPNFTGNMTIDGTQLVKNTQTVQYGGISLKVGADSNVNTLTDATPKYGRITAPHYTNAEEPTMIAMAENVSGNNILYIGGGSVATNAATEIRLLTGATTTTTTGTEAVRINSAGNVGIGVASPSYPLHVQNNDGTGQTIVSFSADLGVNTRAVTIISPEADSIDDPFIFSTGNSYLFRVDATDALLINADGRVGIGTTTLTSGGGKLEVSDGITFPATQSASSNANTLDDYEEGTWTPGLSDGTFSDATLTTAVGTYTKIGDTVHATARIVATSLGSIVGALRLTGLPFNTPVSGAARYVCNFGYAINFAITAGHNPTGYAQPNDSFINLLMWDDTGGTTNLTPTEFSADGSIMLSITYKAV